MNKRGFEFISTSSFILCQHLKRENKIVPKISGRTPKIRSSIVLL